MLLTGGSGKLGKALIRVLDDVLAPSHGEVDITDRDSVFSYIQEHAPDILIHTAAYTSVAGAEENKEECWRINVGGTENLVNALLAYNPSCYFLYVSTACVFYGDRGMYTEEDIPHPKNFYALTKLIGEYVVRRLPNYLIARTNFVAREPWPYPKAFTDRFGTYLYADQVASALREQIEEKTEGLVHIAGDTKLSMFELAKLTTPDVKPISMKDISLPLTVDMSLKSIKVPAVKFYEK